ncbi:hypothetical protein [Paenibacillus donghaensis]|uniref:Uncharacterized protein n=1 Tax=Paenibacillus donghaensis TaxID=414771 RepID=A0A2Z2KF37_9BACL|nr:hypothetical protein [Paenibacillus donghaensis]ASA22565.1 hypothetical protein B9T62_18320 [Paenibacillus donghaensis]
MRLIDQIEDVVRLLNNAKNDLEEWIDVMEEDGWTRYDNSMKETRDLIGEIESVLHNIGA